MPQCMLGSGNVAIPLLRLLIRCRVCVPSAWNIEWVHDIPWRVRMMTAARTGAGRRAELSRLFAATAACLSIFVAPSRGVCASRPQGSARTAKWARDVPVCVWLSSRRLLYSSSRPLSLGGGSELRIRDLGTGADRRQPRLTALMARSGALGAQPSVSGDGRWIIWWDRGCREACGASVTGNGFFCAPLHGLCGVFWVGTAERWVEVDWRPPPRGGFISAYLHSCPEDTTGRKIVPAPAAPAAALAFPAAGSTRGAVYGDVLAASRSPLYYRLRAPHGSYAAPGSGGRPPAITELTALGISPPMVSSRGARVVRIVSWLPHDSGPGRTTGWLAQLPKSGVPVRLCFSPDGSQFAWITVSGVPPWPVGYTPLRSLELQRRPRLSFTLWTSGITGGTMRRIRSVRSRHYDTLVRTFAWLPDSHALSLVADGMVEVIPAR